MQTDVKCTTFAGHDPVPEDVPLLVNPSVPGLTLVDHIIDHLHRLPRGCGGAVHAAPLRALYLDISSQTAQRGGGGDTTIPIGRRA
jgi:hypothetical protein